MSKIMVANGKGEAVNVGDSDIKELESSLKGSLLRPGDKGYDEARAVWNAMIDRKPALIVRCAEAADVSPAVKFANKHGLLTSIKGCGHNIAGNAVCDSGLLIDLSQMRSVKIDKQARVAHVDGGATLGDFDREAQALGLATPLGINSTTGVAGLTLGGGFGWLTRKYGMTADNLTGANVVLADGKTVRASESENSDLFWAIRGGGGNFGVVTQFDFRLHEVGPQVLSGLVVYPLSEGPAVLRKYRAFVDKLSNDTAIWVVIRKAPPLPFLPADSHGKEVLVLAIFHAGDPEEGKKVIEPARHFGTMVGEFIGVQPYTAWQTAFDPLLAPGARNYWKSHNFKQLKDEVFDVAMKYASNLPSPHCEIFFGLLGGVAGRKGVGETAYSQRDANFVLNVHARWENAADDNKCISWARAIFKESAPYATGGVYVNFMTEDETDRVKAAYGPNYERLASIKKKYDPKNLFKMNQNIQPGA